MGYFKNITLSNFRNFENFNLDFFKTCNVFYGKNGSGKTNLLEALSLFTKGRGIRKESISNIIKKNSNNFIVKSDFNSFDINYNLTVESIQRNKRKIKSLNINNDSSKETIDNFYKVVPFLYFMPENERLFLSSPSNRRNFIDRFIFVHSHNYNNLINNYNKNLLERSNLISANQYDITWIKKIERNISEYALEIYFLREKQTKVLVKYLNYFLGKFNINYNVITRLVDKNYNTNLSIDNFANLLEQNRQEDSLLGGSKIGPHKSDYIFYVNNDFLVSQLSTGQQKTLILLIYLSQCKYLIDDLNIQPILLLDEICSHLDDINRKILLTLVESFNLQVFMTGTTKNLFSFLSTKTNFCNITD